MISRLYGKLLQVADNFVTLDVNGVGYEVEVASSVLAKQPRANEDLTLHTHLVVREDAQLLFGFDSQHERDLFRAFIKLNGVGPKLGLALISALDPPTLVAAVHNNDVSVLTKVPGVGKKTAERLMLELKSRIESLTNNGTVPAQVVSVEGLAPSARGLSGGIVREAEDALVALGYRTVDAQKAVRSAVAAVGGGLDQITTQDIVRRALRSFAPLASHS